MSESMRTLSLQVRRRVCTQIFRRPIMTPAYRLMAPNPSRGVWSRRPAEHDENVDRAPQRRRDRPVRVELIVFGVGDGAMRVRRCPRLSLLAQAASVAIAYSCTVWPPAARLLHACRARLRVHAVAARPATH